jgi:hypothetical protein
MRRLFLILFTLSAIVASTLLGYSGDKTSKYQCRHIGISKIKPKKFKKLKQFPKMNPNATLRGKYTSNLPKFREGRSL